MRPRTVRDRIRAHSAAVDGPQDNRMPLEIAPGIAIPDDQLIESFIRAGGPGGQNVNKVASAVELRFDVVGSSSLPDWLRERVLARRDRRLTREGVLVIQAQRFRTQERNREDARARLAALLAACCETPKARVPTRPSRAAKERRIQEKKTRSVVKRGRGDRSWDD